MKINVTDHAFYDRWVPKKGYKKRTQVAAMVRRHLFAALRQGVTLESNAIQLGIDRDTVAVVRPSRYGGWDVVTFRDRKREEAVV